jgi:hypothetical protein
MEMTLMIPARSLAESGSKFRFTPANARQFAEKSHLARKQRALAGSEAIEKLAEVTPQSEEIAEELSRLLGLMRKTSDADKLQKLSAARSRLLAEWQVLTGTPNPGSQRRSSRPNRQQSDAQPQPVVVDGHSPEPIG